MRWRKLILFRFISGNRQIRAVLFDMFQPLRHRNLLIWCFHDFPPKLRIGGMDMGQSFVTRWPFTFIDRFSLHSHGYEPNVCEKYFMFTKRSLRRVVWLTGQSLNDSLSVQQFWPSATHRHLSFAFPELYHLRAQESPRQCRVCHRDGCVNRSNMLQSQWPFE